jgi:HupE / UreJ protein
MIRTFLAALLVLWLSLAALAHDPQLSGIRIIVGKGQTVVSVLTHLSQLNKAEGKTLDTVGIEIALRQRVRLRFGGKDFQPQKTNLLRDDPNDLVTWQVTLPEEVQEPEVLARLYPEDPTSKTVVTLLKDGQAVLDTLVDAAHPTFAQAAPESAWAVALRFLREGVVHIFGGPDHVCFVIGLLLLGGSLKVLLRTVTAFTLAHSITLSLAALGVVTPSARLVEPLIALSIVAIAVENLLPHADGRKDLRPWFAFGFGLIHGFGFAGALAELGLPRQALGAALASFNGGVELGQAVIVLAVAPALAKLAADQPPLHKALVKALSVGIGLAGLYWFITRLLPPLPPSPQ